MQSIWKYPLEITDSQWVALPIGAQPLSVAFQEETLCLWLLIDTDAQQQYREVFIVGTGHRADHVVNAVFVGTAHCTTRQRNLVFHVFIAPESPE